MDQELKYQYLLTSGRGALTSGRFL